MCGLCGEKWPLGFGVFNHRDHHVGAKGTEGMWKWTGQEG
jgi:hypothetical protein